MFDNIVTKTQSCAGSCHKLKISLIRKPEVALSMEMSLTQARGWQQVVSEIFQPLGSVLPTFHYMMLSVPPHIQEPFCIHAKVAVGLWWSLAICSPAPASETSLVQTCLTQQPPSWTVSRLGLSPSPTQKADCSSLPVRHAITRFWHLADFPAG